jgi:DNA-binding CsgD family transcriptional regulator/tetratricopeptide (TPR) repeat protein
VAAVGLDSGARVAEALVVSERSSVFSADGLVGREPELEITGAAVRGLGKGQASALVIEGEAGIGKTRLVQSIVDEAHARGVAVFWGQAHPFERTRPFGVVAAALDLSRRSQDPRRAVIGGLLTAESARDIQYRVVEEVVDLVETACAERPVLFVAEDLHWADSASLLAISTLARQLPLAALLVVVSVRSSPLPAEVVRLLDDLAATGARTLQLRPLGPDEMALLARRMLGASPGPALSAMLGKAGGNPLWAVAILRALADGGMLRREGGGIEPTTFELPVSLSDLVIRRLRYLPPVTLELLQVTAVLGDAVSLRDVAAVAGRSPAEVVGSLQAAFDAQLLDEADHRVVFRHQLVHDAIYQHVPQPARRLLHREAGVALMAAGADRLDVADHLMLGAERGDEQAVAWLRDAAREAAGRAPRVTVELLLRAEALQPDGAPGADLVSAELVQALLRAGKVAEASARAEAALARPHAAELDTPLRLALLGALGLQNRAAELIALAQDSLAGSGLRASEQVLVLAQQSWASTYTGDPIAGESAAGRGLAIAEYAGDAAMTVWALTALLVAVGRQGRFGEALAYARRAATLAAEAHDVRSLPFQPKFFLGLALADCDLIAEARAAYREALDDEFGSGWLFSETLMADSQALFVTGEWDDAGPGLVAGGQAAQEKGNLMLVSQSLAYRAIIATGTGDLQAASDLAAAIPLSPEGEQLSYNAGILAFAVAGLKAAEGDPRGAYELLLRCWRVEAARDSRFYHRWLAPDLVRLALMLGYRDVAAEVADTVAAGVALAPDVPTVRSLALRCRGLVDGAVEPLVEAVALARQAPLLIEHAGTCEDAAGPLAERGRREESAALLGEALERYEQAGAAAWARRVRARLRELGFHPGARGSRKRPAKGWESLTATEREVALLVAEGLTNGAVARRLYISPHTVNTHLRHTFAKLDVTSRVALATVVHHAIE